MVHLEIHILLFPFIVNESYKILTLFQTSLALEIVKEIFKTGKDKNQADLGIKEEPGVKYQDNETKIFAFAFIFVFPLQNEVGGLIHST